jgi:uncharacterized protein YceK
VNRSFWLLGIVFVPVLSGCGTLFFNQEHTPYGGTLVDVGVISVFPTALGLQKLKPEDELGGQGPEFVCLACMGLLDLPFSLVADTLALPITASVCIYRTVKTPSAAEPAVGETVPAGP